MVVSEYREGKATSVKAWAQELTEHHFHHILLVKASHEAGPDSRHEETLLILMEEAAKYGPIFSLPNNVSKKFMQEALTNLLRYPSFVFIIQVCSLN